MKTCLFLLCLITTYSLEAQDCFRVYQQISKGQGVNTGAEIHTRGEWMTVASVQPRGYILANNPANNGCLSYAEATELMDVLRLDAYFTNVCYPWSIWEYTNTRGRVAMPFGENPGHPYSLYGQGGCCESAMWQTDPTGRFAAMDCRALQLTSGRGTVIRGKDGRFYGLGQAIILRPPGRPPINLPPFPFGITRDNQNVSGLWYSQADQGFASVVSNGPFVVMTFWTTKGSSLIRGRFSNQNTFDFNILNPTSKQLIGKGRLSLNPNGTQMSGWWQDNYGNTNNWSLTRYYFQPVLSPSPQTEPQTQPQSPNISACDSPCYDLCKKLGFQAGKYKGVCLAGIPSGTVTRNDCDCQ